MKDTDTQRTAEARHDARLVQRACSGDSDAFTRLYETHLPALFYFIRKRTSSDQDASDIVQDTFVYALLELDKLADPLSFRSWLFRIALSKATDASRAKSRRAGDLPLDAAHDTERAHDALITPNTPEAICEQDEIRDELLACLDQLTPLQKDALILRYYVGFSTKDMAELLGLTPAAVDKRLHDARAALKKLVARQQAPATADSEALIKQLLDQDRQASAAAGAIALPLVSAGLRDKLAQVHSADPQAAERVQNFLAGLEHKRRPAARPAKVAAIVGAAVLATALAVGGYAALRSGEKPPAKAEAPAVVTPPPSPAPTPAPTPAPSRDATPAAPATEATEAGSSAQEAATPAAPAPAPAPAHQPPVITARVANLSYALGTAPTAAQLLADSGAVAKAAGGAVLPITVTGLTNIDANIAGVYLVFLNAQDSQGAQALTLVLRVTIG